MAEGSILIVLQKIAATLGGAALTALASKVGEVASVILEAESIMKEIECEFEIMQAFISQVDPYTGSNQNLDIWLKHIRKTACDVEDIIDEYAFLLGKMAHAESFLKKAFHHSGNIKAWNNIASQLKKVKARLQNLTIMKERYGIKIAGNGGGSSSYNINHQHFLSGSSYLNEADDDEIVGKEDETQKLTQCIDGNDTDLAIISIWGMGGSGKTTLVNSLYRKEKVKKTFDCYAWITVSPNYQIEELLSKVISQLYGSHKHSTTSHNHLVDRIQSYLRNRRYLIILDYMWNKDCWPFFEQAFVKNRLRSRIIITTRIEGVASLAQNDHIIKIGLLSHKESWKLFSKRAFSKLHKEQYTQGRSQPEGLPVSSSFATSVITIVNSVWTAFCSRFSGILRCQLTPTELIPTARVSSAPAYTCPEVLVPWANKILVKCQGLPLAIVAIGSLLSYREVEEQEWRLFYDQLDWQLANNPEINWVSNALKLSLSDLPSHLRNCFLYCALFPEYYQIRRTWIIRLWIAEGFVGDRGTETTQEEVAEDCLRELTQRSLIQIKERNEFGRPKRFQVHDLVRDMALAVSRKERFAFICNQPNVTATCDVANRVSVHGGGQVFQPGPASQHLRSFLLFDKHVSIPWMDTALSNFRLLRVLCLRYSHLKHIPSTITRLFNLHYLDFSRTKVDKIPKSVARLQKLQTLHLKFTRVRALPREITSITSLRHLIVSNDLYGISISGNISRLKQLQTLQEVKANKELAQNLGCLTQVRSLGITGVLRSYNDDLWASVMKMTVLRKLAVATRDANEVLSLQKLRPLRNLEKFYLTGKLAEGELFPISDGFQKLKVLTLRWSGLVDDPLRSLSQMVNLVYLNFFCAYDGEALVFHSGWFPKLKQLYLGKLKNVSWIQIEEGAITNLTYLELRELQKLEVVPEGLKYLRSLQHLCTQKMPGEFVELLGGDSQGLVQHVAIIECV